MNVFQVNLMAPCNPSESYFLLEFVASLLILASPEIDTLFCRGVNENSQKIWLAMHGFHSDVQHHFPTGCFRDYAATGRRAVP